MAEDVTGLEAKDGCFGTTRVSTANPQDLRSLSLAKFGEEFRLELGEVAAPFGVLLEGDGVGVLFGCGKVVSKLWNNSDGYPSHHRAC